MHIHLSETEEEVARCVAAHGARPAAYLDRLGLLGPRTLLAHGVWLDEGEIELIAARERHGGHQSCRQSEARGGSAPFPTSRRAKRGVHVGLGTDGPGSNDSLDLFSDMKTFALLQKHEARRSRRGRAPPRHGRSPPAVARRCSAARHLAQGEPADFLLLRADAPELEPRRLHRGSRLRGLGGGRRHDGRQRQGADARGRVEGEDEVLARALERARRLGLTA